MQVVIVYRTWTMSDIKNFLPIWSENTPSKSLQDLSKSLQEFSGQFSAAFLNQNFSGYFCQKFLSRKELVIG